MPEQIDVGRLARSWVHAHEEDRDDRLVFRPAETPLPPSRGRVVLRLDASGVAGGGGPGPDDRSVRSQGSWELAGNVLTVRLSGMPEQRFHIESVDQERLIARRA